MSPNDNIGKGLDRMGEDIKGFGKSPFSNAEETIGEVYLTKENYSQENVKKILEDFAARNKVKITVKIWNKKESLY